MKTTSSAADTALAATVTRPCSLVQIDWSAPARLSTNGDVTWNTHLWSGDRPVSLQGLTERGGRLVVGNVDLVYGAQCLTEGVSGVPVTVWQGDAAATATADFLLVFAGIADGCEIDDQQVVITLTAENLNTLTSPRVRINAAGGFTVLNATPRINVGGQIIELETA